MLPLKMKHGDVDMKIYAGCITDRGNYRDKNQDRVVCRCISRKQSALAAACVCDGIGSFEKSELAAEMVTAGITHWFEGVREYYPNVMTEEELVEDLDVTIRELNELVYDFRREKGTDIGCTMSVLLLVNRNYYIFHVGDSRIYRMNGTGRRGRERAKTAEAVCLTKDHARGKHVLTKCVGSFGYERPDFCMGRIGNGQALLLCSDGLSNVVNEQEMLYEVIHGGAPEHCCQRLLDIALGRGAPDNVTVVLVRY